MAWHSVSEIYTVSEAYMDLPYFLLIAPNVLYGTCIGKSSTFPTSGHPDGPGGSGVFLLQTRRPTRYTAKATRQASRTRATILGPSGTKYRRRPEAGYNQRLCPILVPQVF